ncbi:MAG: DHA2 family efflux MFS transporter permease subunit [Pseudomonadota bacterium]
MRAGAELTRSMAIGGETALCPKPLRKFVLTVAVLGSSLGFIDGTIITVAIQPIRAGLSASFSQLQWVVNAYTLALTAFLLVGGAAGDRFGRRKIFGGGVTVFAIASAVCGVAPTVEILIGARGVQGLGAALMVPASLALIAVNFPKAERGRAVGIWAAASGVAAALGPILGGLLIELGSWRAVFYVNIPVAAATLLLLYSRVPQDPARQTQRFDLLGAAMAFLAIGALALGFTLAEGQGLTGTLPVTTIAMGLCLGVLFVAWQGRAPAPMLPLELFASATFSIANAQTLLIYFALGGVVFFLPITLMEAKGWTAIAAGAVFLPFTASMAIVSPMAGRLADRIGPKPLLISGPLLVAFSLFVLGPAVRGGDYLFGVAPVMVGFGVGMGLAIPPLSAAILNDAGSERSGIASGVNNAVARMAGLLAVAIMGLLASVLYRDALGLEEGGFGEGAAGLEAAEAMVDTFGVLAEACAGLCVLAALLAAWVPRVARGNVPSAP